MGTNTLIENLQTQLDGVLKRQSALELETEDLKREIGENADQIKRLKQDRTNLERSFKTALDELSEKIRKHIRDSSKKDSVYGMSPVIVESEDKLTTTSEPPTPPDKEKLITLGPIKFSRALLPFIGWGSFIAMIILAVLFGLAKFDVI